MLERSFSWVVKVCLCILVTILPFQQSTSADAAGDNRTVLAQSGPYLELSVTPAAVHPGGLFTLTIVYHDIGLVYTTIQTNPPGLVAFDPPLTMPCKYDSHPNGCTSITMRAMAEGPVTITASATGEIFDTSCQCFRMSGASDNGPVSILVANTIWTMFLPTALR